MLFLDLIAKKRDGGKHTPGELAFRARRATGLVPDYQLAAWLMAVLCRGMDEAETVELTRAMARSGESLGLGAVKRPKADKHSTGGVGDGVSLALAPLAAACGLAVPMMSGRGLGHTGGTLDKLESIKGFQVRLGLPAIRRIVLRLGTCMFGQTGALAPADRTLYALRDATATVPARPSSWQHPLEESRRGSSTPWCSGRRSAPGRFSATRRAPGNSRAPWSRPPRAWACRPWPMRPTWSSRWGALWATP